MEPISLIEAHLLRRYKRFLADVRLADGTEVTVHCPNTGAMTGCAEPGSRVWLRDAANPKRKYRYSWELVETPCGAMACIHSARANALVAEALEEDRLPELAGYTELRREVPIGIDGSRADLLLSGGIGPETVLPSAARPDASRPSEARLNTAQPSAARPNAAQPNAARPDCYIEIKSVTLHLGGGLGVFPDTVSVRASRHLRELMAVARQGQRAVLLFVAQHTGITHIAPADSIDPIYAATLREAMAAGVEVLAYGATVTPGRVRLAKSLPVLSSKPDVQ